MVKLGSKIKFKKRPRFIRGKLPRVSTTIFIRGIPKICAIRAKKKFPRRSYLRSLYYIWVRPYKSKSRRKYFARKNKKKLKNQVYSNINITFQRRNTFINIASNKNQKLLATLSAGLLNYKGRKKASPFVREQIGKQIATYAIKSYHRLVKINFVYKIGRFYRFAIKGLARRGLMIKKMAVKQIHPHGFMRPKKKRRI